MGFERNRVYLLTFEDPDLEGLEVRAKPASAGQLLTLIELMDRVQQSGEENVKDVLTLIRMFGGCPPDCSDPHDDQGGNPYVNRLQSWNLEENGVPVPANYVGLMDQDLDFVTSMIDAWIKAQVGTSDELGKDSNSGGPSPEAQIPMETLSPALLS